MPGDTAIRQAASLRGLALFWGLVSVALLALAPFADTIQALAPACRIESLTGLPCPTCGTTTTAVLLAHLDFGAALRVSPLATAAWSLTVLGGLVLGTGVLLDRSGDLLTRLDRIQRRLGPSTWRRIAVVLVVIALFNWAYLLLRAVV